MYWLTGNSTDEEGRPQLHYNYFTLIQKAIPTPTHYNPVTKIIQFTITQELVIHSSIADSEEAWLVWYENNKNL